MKRTGAIALIVMFIWSTPAGALLQGLDLQTQVQYRLLEIKSRDGAVSSTGGLTTNYGIAMRGPLTPWARLQSNLTVNSLANNDEFGKQDSRNIVFNLGSYERTYRLTMGYVENEHRSVRQLIEGPSVLSTGQDRSYNLNFLLEEPAYPAVNLQLRRRTSSIAGEFSTSDYRSNSWLAGAYYEAKPFRFSIDQSKQTTGFSGSSASGTTVNHRRMAARFDQKIVSGLNLAGEMTKDWSETALIDRPGNRVSGDLKSLRLTATPTSAVVITANRYTRDTTQDFFGGRVNSQNDGSTISMRSEIMRGLALNLTKGSNTHTDPNRIIDSDNLAASLSAMLTPDVTANLVWNSVRQDSMPEASWSKSSTTTAALQMPAGMGLDLTLTAGASHFTGSFTSAFDSKFASAMLRGSLSSDASASLNYRWNEYATRGFGGDIKQKNQSVDLDISWLPTTSLGINARLNYYLNSGNNVSEFISPFIDVNWIPNSSASLTARYNFSKSRQWDSLQGQFVTFGDNGLSLRYTQQLTRDSAFNLIYDFQGNDIGSLEWQRSLRLYFSHRL